MARRDRGAGGEAGEGRREGRGGGERAGEQKLRWVMMETFYAFVNSEKKYSMGLPMGGVYLCGSSPIIW